MSFSDEEIAFLSSQPLARLATKAADGQPDVVPVSFEFDGATFWIGVPDRPWSRRGNSAM